MEFLYSLFCRLVRRPFRLRSVWAASLLLAGACSSSDDSSDDLYAVVQGTSFTFHETDPSLNTVQVLANTAWQVYWQPETSGVHVDPASGSGNGSFRILDMPAGTTLRFGVKPASGTTASLFATVTRSPASEEVALKVSPGELTFDPTGSNRITVTSNMPWTATASDPGLLFSPAGGTGDGTITLSEAPVGTSVLTVTAGQGSAAKKATVTISRAPDSSAATVFSLDFGAAPASAAFADSFTSWQTQTGSGAGSVSYASYGLKIRGGYDGASVGASGKGYATMTATKTANYFTVMNISLPSAERDFTLSFYAAFATGDVVLSIGNGVSTRSLTYQASSSYNVWSKVTVGFTLADPVSDLTIHFAPSRAFDYDDRRYGLNFDDIVLTTGGGGQVVDFGTAPPGQGYRWAELPANWVAPTSDRATISGDYAFYTHWTRSVRSNKVVRNYSYCYDTRRHNPIWVAYPLHTVYGEGGFGRTSPDPWAPDPALDAGYQSKIYQSDGPNGSDPYQFWSTNTIYKLGLSGSWTKGHLCMSRERGGADTEINRQTFYPTNIAPQPNAKASTFGEVWGCIESLISGTNDRNNDITADDSSTNLNIVADTLFVVAGCYYQHDNWTDYDSSDYTQPTPDPNRKLCVMPTHQYKVLLRTRSGNTGKPIQECSASELQCVGFWLDTFTSRDASSARTVLRQIAVPVSEIEQKTGLTFFPDVPASVKEQCNPSDWGF